MGENTDLKNDSVLDILEFFVRGDVIWVTTVEVNEHLHAFLISVHVKQPSVDVECLKSGSQTPILATGTYLGLSGIISDPHARMIPMMHCMNSGTLHARSESIKEQK